MTVRVLHVTSTPKGVGGVERLLLSMAGRFDEGRFEISYTNLFGRGGSKEDFDWQLRASGVFYHDVPGHGWIDVPRMITRLAGILRSENITIVQPHMPHANIIVAAAARLTRVPVILSTRHYYTDEKEHGKRGRRIRALDLRCARAATFNVAVSDAVRRSLNAAGIPTTRISVIPNGVDLPVSESESAAPSHGGRDSRRIVVGCVAGLYAYKGIDDLLRAIASLRTRRDVGLVIVGDGPMRSPLEAMSRDLGISHYVEFTGFRADAARLAARFDIYAQPSRFESFGIAILEAMAAGRPVVATSIGGIPEIVRHGETGILVERGNVPSLVDAIESLVDNPDLRSAMGDAGRRRVAENFTIASTVRQYEALYERLALERLARSSS